MNSIPVSVKMELYKQPAIKCRAEVTEEYDLLTSLNLRQLFENRRECQEPPRNVFSLMKKLKAKEKKFILIVIIVIIISGNNSLQAQWGYKLFHTAGVHSS